MEKNHVVSLSYTLKVDGEVIETVNAERPMEFIFGTGYLLPKFEENIKGKIEGDTFEFTLEPTEAYGEINKDAIVELPKNIFEVDGKIEDGLLTVGNTLPMMDSAGNRLNGTIDEVKDETVVMNFNHPLAGSKLHFTGKVEKIRPATEKEINEGLHGEKVKHDCNCNGGCSSCGGGCH